MNGKQFHWIPLLIIALMTTQISLAQSGTDEIRNWSAGTAYTLPAGRIEVGLFQPLRYGWNDSLEFSTHPIFFIINPNLNAKWHHKSNEDMIFSSMHSFYYPTPLLRLVSREGTGGFISPEFHIPHMFAINNSVLITLNPVAGHWLTLKGGFTFSIKFGGLDERTTIDLPIVYQRLAVFYNGIDFRLSADWYGAIGKHWWYRMDGEIFLFPGAEQNFGFENKGLIYWRKSRRLEFALGYQLVYGEYPYGNQWHLFLPIIDIQFAWN